MNFTGSTADYFVLIFAALVALWVLDKGLTWGMSKLL